MGIEAWMRGEARRIILRSVAVGVIVVGALAWGIYGPWGTR